jgi:hypothetical protein
MSRGQWPPTPKGATISNPDSHQPAKLDRRSVFAALEALGADRALVEFSGGNDEGGPDSIALLRGEETLRTLPLPWHSAEEDKDLVVLADALSGPVFEVYGTLARGLRRDRRGRLGRDCADRPDDPRRALRLPALRGAALMRSPGTGR